MNNKLILLNDGDLVLHRGQASTLIGDVSSLFFYSPSGDYLGLIKVSTLKHNQPTFASIVSIWNVLEVEEDHSLGDKGLKVILAGQGQEVGEQGQEQAKGKCKRQELIKEILLSLLSHAVDELYRYKQQIAAFSWKEEEQKEIQKEINHFLGLAEKLKEEVRHEGHREKV